MPSKNPQKKTASKSSPKKRKASIVVWKSKKDKKFYFHLVSSNGKIIMDNGQGYERRNNLVATLKSIVDIFKTSRFVIEETA